MENETLNPEVEETVENPVAEQEEVTNLGEEEVELPANEENDVAVDVADTSEENAE